jgi:lipopolysaccharide transport protein LptA
MARSRASARSGALLAALLVAPLAAVGALPAFDRDADIHLESQSSDVDFKNNTLAFHGVRITQAGLAIEADEATSNGLDFNNSEWHFAGHVRITTPDGLLTSDGAVIAFLANAISTARIGGQPAAFEQRREGRVARGHALHIDYDFGAGTVRMTDEATLSDGEHEISGHSLTYDMREQRVRASAQDQDNRGVKITIIPKKPDAKPQP